MRTALSVLTVLAIATGSFAAQATQINNEDQKAYSLTVKIGSEARTIEVAPEAVLENVCAKDCVITLGDSEVHAKANETVNINKGKVEIDQ